MLTIEELQIGDVLVRTIIYCTINHDLKELTQVVKLLGIDKTHLKLITETSVEFINPLYKTILLTTSARQILYIKREDFPLDIRKNEQTVRMIIYKPARDAEG